MELPYLVKACDLFMYLNIKFCSFQFEEEKEELKSSNYLHHKYSSESLYPSRMRIVLTFRNCDCNHSCHIKELNVKLA